ncbi:NAD-dependent succinate-semialdehyde dehydrogenase [Amycolatopsis acidicola]|uniref:NAD-dependent succinate-semialdehyde dehydrogenase n=1 Tax=Amycolatopsis acidicola TaxID=2596893 RepID=A0A5N0ULJ9_9PSEU|nr:NAD-dependent succinate-semialdehyde dehydrogenase [Amycolatopsis acidicola]KAA9149434.1 NAD-dependent succinate-semialdehyde dehydrogenase [Amycolatopsis acidicola]
MGTTLINGQWSDPGGHRDVRNPADGSVVGWVGYGGRAEATAAADAAAAAFPAWADTPARARADILSRAADLIRDRAEQIGPLLAKEAGKRLPEGIGELKFSAEYFQWFAEEARRPAGSVHPNEAGDRRHLSIRRPAGVVASLTPWNFPCSIQARKLAPALAAGCTVVARVSDKAPLAATEMIRCLQDAGLPPGVLNLVHGPAAEVTDAYLAHPAVRVVSFTGSTEVGRSIMAKASERVVRPLLELGGNAPFIVFEDADLDAAVEGAMLAKFRNTGQSCIGANRFLVHADVQQEFAGKLAAAVNAMSLGDGTADPVPDLGPCIDEARVRAVRSLVDEALAAGAKKITKDFALPGAAFAEPAILVDVPAHAGLAREEVFGPAAGIFSFRTEAEALALANSTEMGLAAYFYTRDQSRVWRIAEHLDNGIVGINNALPSVAFAPMGGTKQSGLGREGAAAGLEEFEEVRYLALGV